MEHTYILEEIDPIVFYGVNNRNLLLLKILFPKLKIHARGSTIKINGDEEVMVHFIEKMNMLVEYCVKFNKLEEDKIREIVIGDTTANNDFIPENTILFGLSGKPITARTPNQKVLVDDFKKNDMVFAIGPAGSGKTYTAIALAVRALKNKEVKRIILSRPAVEAGENLGFLPGDMKEKIDPYLQPLYDALKDMIPGVRLKEFMESNVIEIAPLAFMRGRTLNDAVVILDEAQNTTSNQMKMFLTRMGMNAKFIITGDITQIDLPRNQKSGLVDALNLLHKIDGISIVEFNVNDIVRHRLVQRIVEAYAKEYE